MKDKPLVWGYGGWGGGDLLKLKSKCGRAVTVSERRAGVVVFSLCVCVCVCVCVVAVVVLGGLLKVKSQQVKDEPLAGKGRWGALRRLLKVKSQWDEL